MTNQLLPSEWDVPQIFRDRLGDGPGRQRAMVADGHLLLVLHKVPQPGQLDREPRLLWRDASGTWQSHEGGEGKAVLKQHLKEYDEVLQSLDAEEHKAVGSQQYLSVLTELAPVLRAARHLHSTLQEAREAVKDERALINARDEAYRLERTMDLLVSDARGSLDVAALQQSEEQAASNLAMARSAHRLNVLAAFFFPLATISGILGVNFNHPLKDDPTFNPFYGMLGISLVCGFLLTLAISRNPASTWTGRR